MSFLKSVCSLLSLASVPAAILVIRTLPNTLQGIYCRESIFILSEYCISLTRGVKLFTINGLCSECYAIAIQNFTSRLTIWTLIWYKCTLARIKEAAGSAVLFISIVMNSRNKSFSQKKLETRALKLDPRFLKALSIEDRVLSRDCQLTFER